MTERRALLLAYYYPPCGGVPVMRWLRFTRNLPARGWRCDVITQQEEGSRDYFDPDPKLLAQVPAGTQIRRVTDPVQSIVRQFSKFSTIRWGVWLDRLVKLVPVPDDKLFWGLRVLGAVRAEQTALRDYELVVATGYPWTTLLVAPFVKRRLGKPLVADLRDPWSRLPGIRVGNALHQRMERWALGKADAVVVVSEGMRDVYAELYPDIAHRIVVAFNGIDGTVTPLERPRSFSDERSDRAGRRLRLLYSGSVLDKTAPKPYQRTLLPMLRMLRSFRKRHPTLAARLDVEVLSNAVPKTEAIARGLGLADMITFSGGRVPFDEVQRAQRAADVLFFVTPEDPKYDRMYMTGKFYEYVAAARPMLAISTATGDAVRNIEKFCLGQAAPTVDSAADALAALLDPNEAFWNRFISGAEQAQAEFDVRRQIDVLCGAFDRVLEQSA